MYQDDPEKQDSRLLDPSEEARLDQLRKFQELKSQPGWQVYLDHLRSQKDFVLNTLAYTADSHEIARLQGVVHALNLIFGTTEGLFNEAAFLSSMSKPKGPA